MPAGEILNSLFDSRHLQRFMREAAEARTLQDVRDLLSEVTRSMGFAYFALAHHVDFRSAPDTAIGITNYPDDWLQERFERRHHYHDPVYIACERYAAGFRWAQLPDLLPLTRLQQGTLRAARSFGLGDGFTAPVNIPGEIAGSCSYAVRAGERLPEEMLPYAQFLGCLGFDAARRVIRASSLDAGSPAPRQSRLTERQLECVLLVARGKSDADIAQLLGISRETVHQHVETAKQRLGIATRTQLVSRALFDGLITFADILR